MNCLDDRKVKKIKISYFDTYFSSHDNTIRKWDFLTIDKSKDYTRYTIISANEFKKIYYPKNLVVNK